MQHKVQSSCLKIGQFGDFSSHQGYRFFPSFSSIMLKVSFMPFGLFLSLSLRRHTQTWKKLLEKLLV